MDATKNVKILTHTNSNKSLRSNRSLKSIRSTRSTQSIRIFNHEHISYQTCFNCLHVKIATCLIGFLALLGVCISLVYCVFISMEQRRPNLKLCAIPMIIVIITLLYMFVGILQQKSQLLFAFITLQIFVVFAIAITIGMGLISVACNTKYVLRLVVDTNLTQSEYTKSALLSLLGLFFQLLMQLWALRTVCGCYRYFTDVQKFELRQGQTNFV